MRVSLKWFACVPLCLSAALLESAGLPGSAQEMLPAEARSGIDAAVTDVLSRSGAPSASVAVVRDGKIVYEHAYGSASLDPATPAAPGMRYSIGSISKQFTAAAMLLLVEQKKLSLDDPVGRWFPELTRSNDVKLSQILSMTSGYQDYWPQDYVMPGMLQPTTPLQIVHEWAQKPLDFSPGAEWQYSNTNYVIAGMIVEKVSGTPLFDFLRQRVFTPLGMQSVVNIDAGPLGPEDPARYMRYALGPARPAPKEGKGWLFAAAELAMTAGDLARWDISMIDGRVLAPASYHAMETETLLANGIATGYGLGVSVGRSQGRRLVSHGGEVSGFTARNDLYPDDRTAVVVLTNLDATGASQQIASRIGAALFQTADPQVQQALERARRVFEGLQHGDIDRSLFTANANAYFNAQALADFASSLAPCGQPKEFAEVGNGLRGGMTLRVYRITCGSRPLRLTEFIMPDGKLEQYQIASAD